MAIKSSLQQRRNTNLRIDCSEVAAGSPERAASHMPETIDQRYSIFEPIGVGTTSVVYRAVRKSNGEDVALKILRTSDDDERGDFVRNEYNLLKQLAHPHIIRVFDFHPASDGRSTLVMELFKGASLQQAVKRTPGGHFSELVARHLALQLLSAIDFLHQRRILHRDVKVQNVLVSEDLQCLKLIDFNTAHHLAAGRALTMTGTRQFAPPEVIMGESPSESSDVWSSGLCLYFMLSGKFPHHSEQCPSLEDFATSVVASRTVSLSGPEWLSVSDACKHVLLRFLEVDKARRPAAMTLLQDPWFSNRSAAFVRKQGRCDDAGVAYCYGRSSAMASLVSPCEKSRARSTPPSHLWCRSRQAAVC